MKLVFELSGEHPELPFAELECVGEILDRGLQVAVAECPDPGAASRLALTHVVLEYLGECEAKVDAFQSLLRDLAISTTQPFAGRARKMHGTGIRESQLELERMIGTSIDGPVSLTSPAEEYRVICSGKRCYFGRVRERIDRGSFAFRNPLRRAFFHPGVMLPVTARALVNISLAREGDRLYDPFCGTGGVLLEAEMLGMRVLGSDADPEMVTGAHRNLAGTDLMRADAGFLPVCTHSIDSVVTDLPYGQSVRIKATSLDNLYHRSLEEIRRILRPGRRAVIVTHQDIREIAEVYFRSIRVFEQRVHKSLTRRIMVLE